MVALRRFVRPLTRNSLEAVLLGEERTSELMPAVSTLDALAESVERLAASAVGSQIDSFLVEPLHTHLSALTRGQAADMRVWHWLCAVAFPELVWHRWRDEGPPDPDMLPQTLTTAVVRRFLGTSTLAGVSRNTLARLWWTGEHLGGDYELARFALSRQDMFQAIFERLFGVYEPAARAALAKFGGRSEDEVRKATKWLNYAASTTALELLDQEAIEAILDESLVTPTP